ncbi:glycoside hydrolase family 3 protein [Cryptosporangium aurantiacum]|uniref:Beta-N-acetylhexosaminidase n=1 Tax=Cryptosporangium aurantiacum TaxID=134849 RepID=A0A1M7JGL3_9ACTN|nr:glycoside hydrolase family 3 N-terminal domain-containing protein [Cryptosporangium aurantiacum]SHM52098.1 beta-N-acetylhexosaminidase [Cryptosporangium aurantiacum]
MKELVDRVLLVGFEEPDPPEWLRRAAPGLGAVVLYGQNLLVDTDAARLAELLHTESDVVLAVDEEGGDVTRVHYREGSPTPGNYVLGAADDVTLTAKVAESIGVGLRTAGIGWNLAPDVDVNSAPENPVIGVRAFGADPKLVSAHASAWIRALEETGVAACAKHFPGHGDTRADSHHALPVVDCSEAEWRRVHLPPFVAAVEAGVRSVMTAHVVVPALDAAPATMSRRLLTGVLRRELGYDGVIVTDALDMGAIRDGVGTEAGAVAALRAGADALCLGAIGGEGLYLRVRSAVLAAVEDGSLPRARLEEAAERVEALRGWLREAPPRPDPEPGWVCGSASLNGWDDPGLEAARRAALVLGASPLAARPIVVEMRDTPNLAVGEAYWDLAGPLAAVGREPLAVHRLTSDAVPLTLDLPDGLPVVVVGRDVARSAWQRAAWQTVYERRPDAVLVDIGLPRPDVLTEGPRVFVGGAGRPNLRVAAELLAGIRL